MKFIKVTTKHTALELREILKSYNDIELEQVHDTYAKLDYVEFVDEDGFVGMFCILSKQVSDKLIGFYVNSSIKFSFEDLSKDVLLVNPIKKDYKLLLDKNNYADVKVVELASRFYEDNIDVDTILDKINEKGIGCLTEFDKKILK